MAVLVYTILLSITTKAGQGEDGTTGVKKMSEDLPKSESVSARVTDKSIRLPYNMAILLIGIVFTLGGTVVEARIRLGDLTNRTAVLSRALDDHKERGGHPLLSERVNRLERDFSAFSLEQKRLSGQMTLLVRSIDAICLKMNAACPSRD